MRPNALTLLLLACCGAIALGQHGSTGTTDLRTSDDVELKQLDLRGQLSGRLQELRRNLTVTEQLVRALKENDDGSRTTAVKINLVQLIMARDEATLLSTAAPALTNLRWSLEIDRLTKKRLALSRRTDAQRTQRRINTVAEKVVAAQEKVARLPKGSPERRELEDQVFDGSAELEELVRTRDQRVADADAYAEQAQNYKTELKDLEILDRRLANLGRRARIRVDRLGDAIQHEQAGVVSDEVAQDRATIRTAIDMLGERSEPIEPHSTRANPVVTRGVSAGEAIDRMPREDRSTSPRVVAELAKARSRTQQATSAPAPAETE